MPRRAISFCLSRRSASILQPFGSAPRRSFLASSFWASWPLDCLFARLWPCRLLLVFWKCSHSARSMRHSAVYRKSGAGKTEITASGQIRRVSYLPETIRSGGRHSRPCRHPRSSKTPRHLPYSRHLSCSRQGVRRFEVHLPLFDAQLEHRHSIDRPSRRQRSEQRSWSGATREFTFEDRALFCTQ